MVNRGWCSLPLYFSQDGLYTVNEEANAKGEDEWLVTGHISNGVLLYSTGNYIQSLGVEHNGRWYEKKNVFICITESLCCTAEIDVTL